MQPLVDPKLLERLRIGSLAQYFDIYLSRLERDGFLHSSVPCQAYAITRFSKWLQQKDIRPDDLDESTVRKFLDRDPGVVHYPERATLRRLMSILRELGIVRAESPVPLTPVEQLGKDIVFDITLSDPPGYACFTCHTPETGFASPFIDIMIFSPASRTSAMPAWNAASVARTTWPG